MEFAVLMAKGRELRAAGCSRDEVLDFLRTSGASKIDSMRVLVELEQLSLAVAKEVVDSSPVWQDLSSRDAEVREDLSKALHDLYEEGEQTPGMQITGDDE
jgi:ribosomal protein L7/L12